jgi:hypothetical protein
LNIIKPGNPANPGASFVAVVLRTWEAWVNATLVGPVMAAAPPTFR